MNTEIVDLKSREILDSRGVPTVEIDISLADGSLGRAAVPSGASTGKMEAFELRDGDPKRYFGKGVLQSVHHANTIIKKALLKYDALQQSFIDQILSNLDNTSNKSNLGANTILGVSLAVAKAAAMSLKLPLYQYLGGMQAATLPVPMINVINGGVHADNMIDFQEFMIIPHGAPSFKEALKFSAEVFNNLRNLLRKKNYNTNVGDEGGFAPNLKNAEDALQILIEAIEISGYSMNTDFSLGIDVAASTMYSKGSYKMESSLLNSTQFIDYYIKLVDQYPITSIEDPLYEEDYVGWQLLTEKLGNKTQIVGDDLFVTNCAKIKTGIELGMANAVLIKPNQIGTVSETIAAIKLAKDNGYRTIVSHRSGETEDCSIAHLAVAMNCGQIKTGSLSRSERVAKYNELLRIEEHLGAHAVYGNKI